MPGIEILGRESIFLYESSAGSRFPLQILGRESISFTNPWPAVDFPLKSSAGTWIFLENNKMDCFDFLELLCIRRAAQGGKAAGTLSKFLRLPGVRCGNKVTCEVRE